MKYFTAFLLLAIIRFMAPAAQHSIGTVKLKNGKELDSVEITLPGGTEEEVRIKFNGKKTKLRSDSIESLILWHKAAPDKKYIMKYSPCREIDYEKGTDGLEKINKWFVLIDEGPNVSLWVYACMVDVGKNGISTGPCDSKYGYNTFYNFWEKGEQYPVYMKFNRKTEKTEAWCAEFFSDDSVLSAKIKNKEYRAKSYKESRRFGTMLCAILVENIVADYSPVR